MIQIELFDEFKRDFKRLAKKFRTLPEELEELITAPSCSQSSVGRLQTPYKESVCNRTGGPDGKCHKCFFCPSQVVLSLPVGGDCDGCEITFIIMSTNLKSWSKKGRLF